MIVFFITLIPSSINLFAQLNAVFPDKICKLSTFYLVVLERRDANRRYVPAEFLLLNLSSNLAIRLEISILFNLCTLLIDGAAATSGLHFLRLKISMLVDHATVLLIVQINFYLALHYFSAVALIASLTLFLLVLLFHGLVRLVQLVVNEHLVVDRCLQAQVILLHFVHFPLGLGKLAIQILNGNLQFLYVLLVDAILLVLVRVRIRQIVRSLFLYLGETDVAILINVLVLENRHLLHRVVEEF